jgi:O-antigen ligase
MSGLFMVTLYHIPDILDTLQASRTAGGLLLYVLFFSALLFTPDAKKLNYIAKAFVVSGIIFSFLIFIFRYEYEPGRYSIFLYRYPTDPNHLACFMVLSFIIALKKTCFPTNGESAALYLSATFCILTATLLTGSRMAFFALIAGAFIILSKDFKKFLPLIISGAALFIAAFLILPDVLTDRFLYNSYYDGSNIKRVVLWQQAWNAISLHPLIGYGVIDSRTLSGLGAAHNTFLAMTLYFGFIGVSFIAVILAKITYCIVSLDMRLYLSLFAALMLMSLIIENTVTMPFWFALIFIMWAVNLKKSNPEIKLWEQI